LLGLDLAQRAYVNMMADFLKDFKWATAPKMYQSEDREPIMEEISKQMPYFVEFMG